MRSVKFANRPMIIRNEQIVQLDKHYREKLVSKVVLAVRERGAAAGEDHHAQTDAVVKALKEATKMRVRIDEERIAYTMLYLHRNAGRIPQENFEIMQRDILADSRTAIFYEQKVREQIGDTALDESRITNER